MKCGTVLILILNALGELTTSAHGALKHLKHDAIEARDAGPAGFWRSGGSITAESFYNMEPHKAPETWRCWRASTWSARQNMSDKRPGAILAASCARCSMAPWLHVCSLAVDTKTRPDRDGFSEALAHGAVG